MSEQTLFAIGRLLLAAAAFALYAVSSGLLASRWGGALFGADAHLYAPIAQGEVYDRVFRFHPVTVASAELWMVLHKPFAGWIGPQTWLRLLFAATGAAGVWMAATAFARLVPARIALLGGALYALSFAIWFFSGIEESKIFSATLAAAYIALWLKLREQWSLKGALWLTLVLFVACMNEIVAGLLVGLPALDELLRRNFDVRKLRWVFAHALAVLLALIILETALPARMAPETGREGASHFQMMFHYLTHNEYSFSRFYAFALNWFLFSFAAPETVRFVCRGCDVYFDPSLANYFASPWRAAALLWLCALIVLAYMPKWRREFSRDTRALLLALMAYSLARGVFFFIFNPDEVFLYTPSVVLPHLIPFMVVFSAARIPGKFTMLAVLAILLFIANGLFIIGA